MKPTITYKQVREIFSYNKKTGILKWKNPPNKQVKVGEEVGYLHSAGYRRVKIFGKKYQVHRIIWLYVYGYLPENDIDHINRIKDDNRLCNLREVSRSCNIRNACLSTNNTSNIKGVCFDTSRNKWISTIYFNNKAHTLGRYNNFHNAVCARLAAEQCLGWPDCDSRSSSYLYVKDNIILRK